MKIRKANLTDFKKLYALGLKTPELRVSATEPFMDKDDFKKRINGKNHVFLLAEVRSKIIGFIIANAKDANSPLENRYACIVYVVVSPDYRNRGVATQLYDACMKKLKKLGITHVYAWADMKSGVIFFLKKKGFNAGKPSVWMDKKL